MILFFVAFTHDHYKVLAVDDLFSSFFYHFGVNKKVCKSIINKHSMIYVAMSIVMMIATMTASLEWVDKKSSDEGKFK